MVGEKGIPFNGFQSVLEMLRHSDPAFRNRLLSNVRGRDPGLARRLETELQAWFAREQEEGSVIALERGQRLAYTRNYGN